jgi:hypothetical protein
MKWNEIPAIYVEGESGGNEGRELLPSQKSPKLQSQSQ